MLRNITDLRGYTIHATDGDLGTVKDSSFDDDVWTVRHLVAPMAQVTARPDIDATTPVSRQSEAARLEYYAPASLP